MKQCCHCKKIKNESEFYNNKSTSDGLQGLCKKCNLIANKKTKASKKGVSSNRQSTKKWTMNNLSYRNNWRNSEKGKNSENESIKKYQQSEKGRCAKAKVDAKRNRKLRWTKLFPNPFANSVAIEWHHISDEFVVAIPKDLHRSYNGSDNHRELCMNIINQIYMDGK